jgi:hypothetical protein
MRARSDDESALLELLRDPLIRLVMCSDGVTEQTMIAVMEGLRHALAVRECQTHTATEAPIRQRRPQAPLARRSDVDRLSCSRFEEMFDPLGAGPMRRSQRQAPAANGPQLARPRLTALLGDSGDLRYR